MSPRFVGDNLDANLHLVDIVRQHGEESPDVIREKILAEIRRFVGTASPHDDMTLVLVKLEERSASAAA